MSELQFLCTEAARICGCDDAFDNLSEDFIKNFPVQLGSTKFREGDNLLPRIPNNLPDDIQKASKAANIFADFAVIAGHSRPRISYRTDLGLAYLTWSNMGWEFYEQRTGAVRICESIMNYPSFPKWLGREEEYVLNLEKMDEWPIRLVRFIATVRVLYPQFNFRNSGDKKSEYGHLTLEDFNF